MSDTPIAVRRAVLEQRFFDAAGNIETHQLVPLSVIGAVQEPALLTVLQSLDYDEHRFTSPRSDAGGAWIVRLDQTVPSVDFAVIGLAATNAPALAALEAEVTYYWAYGALPLIIWPGRAGVAERIRARLAPHARDWRFIHADVNAETGLAKVASVVAAVVVPAHYPGFICVDTLDVRAVLAAGRSVRVVSFAAPTFDLLMDEIEHVRCEKLCGLFAALHGPTRLRLNQVRQFMYAVCAVGEGDFTFVGAALADQTREHYALHLTLCE